MPTHLRLASVSAQDGYIIYYGEGLSNYLTIVALSIYLAPHVAAHVAAAAPSRSAAKESLSTNDRNVADGTYLILASLDCSGQL